MSTSTSAPVLPLESLAGKPVVVQAQAAGDAPRWAAEHRDALRAAVLEHGALLVRGLSLGDAAQVGAVLAQLGASMAERESFAPRRTLAPGVYSSTKWPPNQPMCMHHELSYALEFPGLLLFACLVAPHVGGATPVADSAAVLRALPAALVARFEREGWLLVRNYNDDIGASIAGAFGTDDRSTVESFCRSHSIRFEWRPEGGLRTWQQRGAILPHPVSGQPCWFNQAAFLSEWTMDSEVREYLVDLFGADGLPFRTQFGNGEPIGPDIVQAINEVYDAHTAREPWQAGDVMLVDNIRTAHAREPFEGPREVLVGMADAMRRSEAPSTHAVHGG